MYLLPVVVVCATIFLVAYRVYGGLLSRWFKLDPNIPTPATELRDDIDYVPTEPKFLIGQHFSAIAAAGPIVGPIMACVMFGWVPALLWIIIGSIFIGGVHDMAALVASIRHKARSIAEVVREYMSPRSYVLFLIFIWISLVYVIVAFTDITAGSFVGKQTLENGEAVTGAGIAASSMMYLALPIVMGLLMRYCKLSLLWATVIFLPLVGVAIWAGQYIQLDVASLLNVSETSAHKVWDVLLLGYCLLAAIVPVWLLLQPRGHLGGYFLLAALGAGAFGVLVGGRTIQFPAFLGWTTAKGENLFPILFITIACGACSGFHALIASGTSSKQLKRETDARPIGYGTMLLEGMVAVISLCCVMMLVPNSPLAHSKPNNIYANGIQSFLLPLGIPAKVGVTFALMAFATFVYDTLDICTRLGKYILQELTGLKGRAGAWIGTGLTAGVPLFFVMQTTLDAKGNPQPVWQTYWSLFGATNQLLAALTLLGLTVWLWRGLRARWSLFVTGIPMILMYVMSVWALLGFVLKGFEKAITSNPIPWVALILVALAILMLFEAFVAFSKPQSAKPVAEPVTI
jgi:carbon starvation protein